MEKGVHQQVPRQRPLHSEGASAQQCVGLPDRVSYYPTEFLIGRRMCLRCRMTPTSCRA